MNDALRKLDGLTTIIHTDQAQILRFVVASVYEILEPDDFKTKQPAVADEDDDEEEESVLSSRKRSRTAHGDDINSETVASLLGTWTVSVGCDQGWWSTSFDSQALLDLTSRSIESQRKSSQVSMKDIRSFSNRITSAFERRSILFGGNRSKQPSDWGAIKLYLDLEANPIELKLKRLSPLAALEISTKLIFNSSISASSSSALGSLSSSSFELHSLQRKLESTQQALREERHKYRSLLAAPSASASSARNGRRPVVGLGPSLPSASQRSPLPPSSQSSESRSRGMPSSSSGAGPSSDDWGSVSGDTRRVGGSQRTLSLVNPTRVQRANPGENEGFVGDEDDES